MLRAAKNFMTSQAARKYVGHLIARYGELKVLKIDTKHKTVKLECVLHGETKPIVVQVDEYRLDSRGGRCFARVVQCTCSRPWAQNLAEDYVIDREMEVPSWAASAF